MGSPDFDGERRDLTSSRVHARRSDFFQVLTTKEEPHRQTLGYRTSDEVYRPEGQGELNRENPNKYRPQLLGCSVFKIHYNVRNCLGVTPTRRLK